MTASGMDKAFDEKLITGYIDGHNIDFIKGKVAFDLEWNSKDQTFDRDLLAMRTYFDCGLIEVGIIFTRAEELNDIFSELGSDFALESHLLFTVSGGTKSGVVGFLGGHIVKQESCGYIDWLFVDKKWQRQGVGRALICAYEQYLKSNGIKNEKLMSVSTTNAINFYISGGFKRVLADSNLMQKVL